MSPFMKQSAVVYPPIIQTGLKKYPNVLLNCDDGPFCLQCMKVIQVTKPAEYQWNKILDTLVTNIKQKKSTIDCAIYIKVLYDGTSSFITVSTDGFLKTSNNETEFPELRKFFEDASGIKFQELSELKYQNFRIFQSPLGFSVDQTDNIMELVNEWFPAGKSRNVDTHFCI